jgi:hypothetical protein
MIISPSDAHVALICSVLIPVTNMSVNICNAGLGPLQRGGEYSAAATPGNC